MKKNTFFKDQKKKEEETKNPHTNEETNYQGTNGRNRSFENEKRNKLLHLEDGTSGH